jgi:hypothetical protein
MRFFSGGSMRCWGTLLLALLVGGLLAAQPPHWKAVLATGYSSDDDGNRLDNWDNAREAVRQRLLTVGLRNADISLLSTEGELIGTEVDHNPIRSTSKAGLADALLRLDLRPGDGLILFLSSHGAQGEGWVLEYDGDEDGTVLTPLELKVMLDQSVGNLPAVIWLSSCFAGQFLDDGGIKGPHRVVMTAARRDRSSFGCGAGTTMPEWDESLLKVWSTWDLRKNWRSFATAVAEDIARKEVGHSEKNRSYPQFAVGALVDFGVF